MKRVKQGRHYNPGQYGRQTASSRELEVEVPPNRGADLGHNQKANADLPTFSDENWHRKNGKCVDYTDSDD